MTAAEIAEVLGLAISTVSRWLKRIGLGKRSRLEPPEPPNRYERSRPGELIHVDVKKLGRIAGAGHRMVGHRKSQNKRRGARQSGALGWEFVHVCVDDATRLAFVEVLPDEKGATAAGFLRRAAAWFAARHGIALEAVISDNGACYRSGAHARACAELGMRHLFTRPYRPRTNGKAERFIQTLTDKWAYGAISRISARTDESLAWLAQPLQLPPTTRLPRQEAARSSACRTGTTWWVTTSRGLRPRKKMSVQARFRAMFVPKRTNRGRCSSPPRDRRRSIDAAISA